MIRRITLALLSALVLLTSCEYKDLCYNHEEHALRYHIDIKADYRRDWEDSSSLLYKWKENWPQHYIPYEQLRPELPTGLRVLTYHDSYSEPHKSNIDPEGGIVMLSEGLNDILLYNNDTEYILFSTNESNEYYYATTRSNARIPYTRSYTHYNQPDQLFGTFMQDLYVTDDPDAYEMHFDADGTLYYVYDVNAALTPYTFIYLCQVMLLNNNDDAGKRVTGCEGVSFNRMAGGVDLFTRVTDSTNLVTITQEEPCPVQTDRTLRLPDGTETAGDILAARLLTWGMPGIDPLEKVTTRSGVTLRDSIHAGIGLTLRNGSVYAIEQDITDQMEMRPAGGVITIVVDAAEIPDSIIGGKPKPGGGFDASVENWENEIESDIII